MPSRFTTTEKWKDAWFCTLKRDEKLMFNYVCDTCDCAGFFEFSMKQICVDMDMTPDEVKTTFRALKRSFFISIDKHIYYIKNFLKHQKNLPLNKNNNSHIGIYKCFEKYKNRFNEHILIEVHREYKIALMKGAIEGLPSGYGKGNGNSFLSKEDLLFNDNSFSDYIKEFNTIRQNKFRETQKVLTSFKARIAEGFTHHDMITGLKNAMTDKFHIESEFNHLTPEFFTRADKLDLYLNYKQAGKKQSNLNW